MTKPLFSIRPLEDAVRDCVALKQQGVMAYALPMLNIKPQHDRLADLLQRAKSGSDHEEGGEGEEGGLILTSKQAARMLAPYYADPDNINRSHINYSNINYSNINHYSPIWCVGQGTAQILHEAGAQHIMASAGTARMLAERMRAYYTKPARLIWLSGADIHFDIGAGLAQHRITVTRHVIYEAARNNPDPNALHAALSAGHLCGIMALSTRSLRAFDQWLCHHGLNGYKECMMILTFDALTSFAQGLDFSTLSTAHAHQDAHSHWLGLAKEWAQM